MNAELIPVFNLSWSEKLQLVQDLWDDLAASSEDLPVSKDVLDELDRRKAAYLKQPGAGSSWDEVKQRIRSRHGR